MSRMPRLVAAAAGAALLACWAGAGQELLKSIPVPAAAGWVDTGLDVEAGREIVFLASGEISLQVGNAEAACGPAGLDLRSMQQPIPDRNLGALVGKVAQVVGVRKDEETGEEIPDEIVRLFYIGPDSVCAMPLSGRLYLGVNENVIRDNAGEFSVSVSFRRP